MKLKSLIFTLACFGASGIYIVFKLGIGRFVAGGIAYGVRRLAAAFNRRGLPLRRQRGLYAPPNGGKPPVEKAAASRRTPYYNKRALPLLVCVRLSAFFIRMLVCQYEV